jgi:hypothetical protein
MEKNRYYCELPGDVWEQGTLMELIKENQEQRVGGWVAGHAVPCCAVPLYVGPAYRHADADWTHNSTYSVGGDVGR